MISQPRGLSGMPSAGHCSGGREQRLLHGVLGDVEVSVAADHRAEDLRRQLAQQVLDRSVRPGDDQTPARRGTRRLGRTSAYALAAANVRDRAVRRSRRRSRWPGRSSRTRRSSSRRGPPGSRRTGRRSRTGTPSFAPSLLVWTGAASPRVSTSSPDSIRSWLNFSMNAPIAAKSSADQAGLSGVLAGHAVVVLLRGVRQDHVLHDALLQCSAPRGASQQRRRSGWPFPDADLPPSSSILAGVSSGDDR